MSVDLPTLSTSHSAFHEPVLQFTSELNEPNGKSSSQPSRTLCLRGVNLSSTAKFPALPRRERNLTKETTREQRDMWREQDAGMKTHLLEGFWEEAEAGGREGWFSGRPLKLEGIDIHLKRLRMYGFNAIRYLVVWEALEHSGPGKYDEQFIDYTIKVLRKLKEYGFRVYMDPHQDVFSRLLGGSGAPYWVLLACGLAPRRTGGCGAAYIHCEWPEGPENFPEMIWNTNVHRLAARHCFTLFYAGKTFAPKCMIDGVNVQDWLQTKWLGAYGHLADRIRDAGGLFDCCIIGWDSLNEPGNGFVGISDINVFPEAQDFKKGPTPKPLESLKLGYGQACKKIEVHDFTSLGPKKSGTTDITPPDGKACWLTRLEAAEAGERWGWQWGPEWSFWNGQEGGCVWAGHGVWDPISGEALQASYFHHPESSPDKPYEFIRDFWKPQWQSYVKRIRQAHPDAICFVNPPVFERPPDLDDDATLGRMCLSAHYYDGMTLLGKRRHLFNADAVGLQRGLLNLFSALKFGEKSIRSSLRSQLGELSGDASDESGLAGGSSERKYPSIIGEVGVPFDMKKTGLLGLAKGKAHRHDYTEPAKSMDEALNACDGQNTLGYTLWCYEPYSTHKWGDGWNLEDLSLFSFDDTWDDDGDLKAANPPDLHHLLESGARGIQAWCRPYAYAVNGRVYYCDFSIAKGRFKLEIEVGGEDAHVGGDVPTLVYIPFVHFRQEGSTLLPQLHHEPGRVVGEPLESGEEWTKGNGPARNAVEVDTSEGHFEMKGQTGSWYYDASGEKRTISLVVRRIGGSLWVM